MIETEMLRVISRFATEAVLALAPVFGPADERLERYLDAQPPEAVLVATRVGHSNPQPALAGRPDPQEQSAARNRREAGSVKASRSPQSPAAGAQKASRSPQSPAAGAVSELHADFQE